jgi:hypothetical protein
LKVETGTLQGNQRRIVLFERSLRRCCRLRAIRWCASVGGVIKMAAPSMSSQRSSSGRDSIHDRNFSTVQ